MCSRFVASCFALLFLAACGDPDCPVGSVMMGDRCVEVSPMDDAGADGGVAMMPDDGGGEDEVDAGEMDTDAGCVPDGELDLPDGDGVDSDCDGIDGTIERAVFVSASTGSDDNPGTMDEPKQTIGAAFDLADENAAKMVLVAEGTYEERVSLRNGVALAGGYASDWNRSFGPTKVVASGSAVTGTNIDEATLLTDFEIESAAAEPGESTIAVKLVRASGLVIERVEVHAGDGGDGADGLLYDSSAMAGDDGENGEPAHGVGCAFFDVSPSGTGAPEGGAGGSSGRCTTCGGGGKGGRGREPEIGGEPGPGAPGLATTSSGSLCLPPRPCVPLCEEGVPGGAPGSEGRKGTDGADGDAGEGGASAGSFGSSGYSPADGVPGEAGAAAEGGSGGGGGYGVYIGDGVNCFITGGGGGGGGSGGCGGQPGRPGEGGGASVALLLVDSSPTLRSVSLATGDGGRGGDGAAGQAGGAGGEPGEGGAGLASPVAGPDGQPGADGGKGGRGGDGGAGGGGGGGPSLGIVLAGGSALSEDSTGLTFDIGAAGVGGQGGASDNAGADGVSEEMFSP